MLHEAVPRDVALVEAAANVAGGYGVAVVTSTQINGHADTDQ